MKTSFGHLTYCSNIHPGESWADHFMQLQNHVPIIKQNVSPHQPMGIGLRLSNLASLELSKENTLKDFQHWLRENDCYVFTMNGFPYGGFHDMVVKENVHTPHWATYERLQYTIRLFRILAALLPKNMQGGISTSPLSYKLWHQKNEKEIESITEKATFNILQVVIQLINIKKTTGQILHLDIEPEPDGLLENSDDFFSWYHNYLLRMGIPLISEKFNITENLAAQNIREHIQLCYDVCHFAIEYEDAANVLQQCNTAGISIGKVQLSAALKIKFSSDEIIRNKIAAALQAFNETTYLHQVIARQRNGNLLHYPDLPQALNDVHHLSTEEWRAHFHVPLFWNGDGLLQSTQQDVINILELLKKNSFAQHLEVETYTWNVLPSSLQLPINESICREIKWAQSQLQVE